MNFSPTHCFFLIGHHTTPVGSVMPKRSQSQRSFGTKPLKKGNKASLWSNEEARLHPRSNHPLFPGKVQAVAPEKKLGDIGSHV